MEMTKKERILKRMGILYLSGNLSVLIRDPQRIRVAFIFFSRHLLIVMKQTNEIILRKYLYTISILN